MLSKRAFKNSKLSRIVLHRSAATNLYGDISSKGSKVLIDYC